MSCEIPQNSVINTAGCTLHFKFRWRGTPNMWQSVIYDREGKTICSDCVPVRILLWTWLINQWDYRPLCRNVSYLEVCSWRRWEWCLLLSTDKLSSNQYILLFWENKDQFIKWVFKVTYTPNRVTASSNRKKFRACASKLVYSLMKRSETDWVLLCSAPTHTHYIHARSTSGILTTDGLLSEAAH